MSKAQKRKWLWYAGFAFTCNARQYPFSPLQGGGRWFEPSIAHFKKWRFAGKA
jgi:hypothetical protein